MPLGPCHIGHLLCGICAAMPGTDYNCKFCPSWNIEKSISKIYFNKNIWQTILDIEPEGGVVDGANPYIVTADLVSIII